MLELAIFNTTLSIKKNQYCLFEEWLGCKKSKRKIRLEQWGRIVKERKENAYGKGCWIGHRTKGNGIIEDDLVEVT